MKLFNTLLLTGLASTWSKVDVLDLFQLNSGWINDLLKKDNSTPPVMLKKPTNVQVPSIDRVQFHLNTAIVSDCYGTSNIYMSCLLGRCSGFKMLKSYDNLYYGSVVVIGVYEDRKELVVSHRGSFSLQNWLRDFSYGFVPFTTDTGKTVNVHNGFYSTYLSYADIVNAYLFNLLKDPKYDGYKVIITGQSLGGATSTLHATDIANRVKATGHEIELFAYHSPRVGDKSFVDYVVSLNIPIARYTNRGDIVSQVPFRHMGYVHIPGEVHLDFTILFSANPKVCSQAWDEDPKCQWNDRAYLNPVDHLMAFSRPLVPMC